MSRFTTPRAEALAQLLDANTFGSVTLTNDEFRAIKDLYGFKPETPNERPEPPVAPKREDFKPWEYDRALREHEHALELHGRWQDPMPMMQAGADKNAIRHASADGLRMVAWFAKYVEAGQDPLKLLVQLASDCGWDVDPEDFEWANNDDKDG